MDAKSALVSFLALACLCGLASAQAAPNGASVTCYSLSFNGICMVGGGATQALSGQWHTNIFTTDFGQPSCGDPVGPMASGISSGALSLYAALPTRAALGRTIEVKNALGGQDITLQVLDVGPWNTNDDNYVFNPQVRPEAESGIDNTGRTTNRAGLDLSCAAYSQLGLGAGARGLTDWRFVS